MTFLPSPSPALPPSSQSSLPKTPLPDPPLPITPELTPPDRSGPLPGSPSPDPAVQALPCQRVTDLSSSNARPPPPPFDIEKRRRLVGVLDGGEAGARRERPPGGAGESNHGAHRATVAGGQGMDCRRSALAMPPARSSSGSCFHQPQGNPDPAAAIPYFERAAEADHALAATNLGRVYIRGIGVAALRRIGRRLRFG